MVSEVLAELAVRPGGLWVDATVNGGGHAEAILEASGPDGRLFGIDMDASALAIAQRRLKRFADRVILMHGRFSQVDQLLARVTDDKATGVLADLGPSRHQLTSPVRGFSFASDARLDARYDRSQKLTAWHVVNQFSRQQLVKVLSVSGRARQARLVADAILKRRQTAQIETVRELAEVIKAALGKTRSGRVDASTVWLMCIRMAVNRELEEAEEGIEAATRALAPGGRLVVISWDGATHRVVRRKLRSLAQQCQCPPDVPCTCARAPALRLRQSHGLTASQTEQAKNPATRTCRLFSAERLPLIQSA
jgi:16S rRNA (cytosine1402-N4)-methyltransferase